METVIQAIWNKLQFGFDLILPVVAVWALFKWIRESKQKAITETTKAALISNLNKLIERSSSFFVNEVVESCQSFEKPVNHVLRDIDFKSPAAIETLRPKRTDLCAYVSNEASVAREKIDEFYAIAVAN